MGIKRRRKVGAAVYLLPNLLTTGNLYFGFFSIIKSLQGQFEWAAMAILLSSVFDVLDGRVARLTNSTSEFGVQYDSLCDLVSFGVAPALLMYQYQLHSFGRLGWIISFVFMATGALRLARFNVQSSIGQSNGDFTGIPIPLSAMFVSLFIAFMLDIEKNFEQGQWFDVFLYNVFHSAGTQRWFLLVSSLVLSFLMISNVAFRSHKSVHISGINPFRLLAISVIVLGVLAFRPEMLGFLLVALYALSGPFEWLIGWKKLTQDDDVFSSIDSDQSVMEPTGTREDDK